MDLLQYFAECHIGYDRILARIASSSLAASVLVACGCLFNCSENPLVANQSGRLEKSNDNRTVHYSRICLAKNNANWSMSY